MPNKRIDLAKISTVPLCTRPSKVNKNLFSRPVNKKTVSLSDLWPAIPNILAGKSIRNLVQSIVRARSKNKPVLFAFGAHVIKCGLSPLIIDLCKRGFITHLATNGASTVHDFELAYAGITSEDVAVRLQDGTFGMAKETGQFVNNAANMAAIENTGVGYALGREIERKKLPNRSISIFAQAYKLGITTTVHVAVGTDILSQHPQYDGAAWGKASYGDFLRFAETVSFMGNGGVMINFGSAVIIPEVFLKALTVAKNLGYGVNNITTANFDMIRQYRPQENIVYRPTIKSGQGLNFIGQHEIMLPLLYCALIDTAPHQFPLPRGERTKVRVK
jgi:hypothetical protein